jgi:hypothetical protein
MKSFFKYIVDNVTQMRFKNRENLIPKKQYEKEINAAKVEVSHLIKEGTLILLGVICASIGLKGFLLPNAFIDGGATGISLILTEITGFFIIDFSNSS